MFFIITFFILISHLENKNCTGLKEFPAEYLSLYFFINIKPVCFLMKMCHSVAPGGFLFFQSSFPPLPFCIQPRLSWSPPFSEFSYRSHPTLHMIFCSVKNQVCAHWVIFLVYSCNDCCWQIRSHKASSKIERKSVMVQSRYDPNADNLVVENNFMNGLLRCYL